MRSLLNEKKLSPSVNSEPNFCNIPKGMKKLFLISTLLLFGSNVWAEQLYFACECEQTYSSTIIHTGERQEYETDCKDEPDSAVTIDLENKTIRLGDGDTIPMIITETQYKAENCRLFEQDDENICYYHRLNRITLKLFSNAPAWWLGGYDSDDKRKGRYRSTFKCEFRKRY